MDIIFKKINFKIKKIYLYFFSPNYPDCVKVKTPEQTLKKITDLITSETPGAYLRFGDGEINVLNGVGAMEQKGDTGMIKEMDESFRLNGEGVMKSLMIHSKRFGFSKGMIEGFHLTHDDWATNMFNYCYQYFIGDYIYSHTALSYALIYQREKALKLFKLIKSHNGLIFVGNETINKAIIENIFGESCLHIKTPPKDAFKNIDEIENKIINQLKNKEDYSLIIFAVGPSSNILQKRIFNKNINAFTFDIGSVVDALSGSQTRAWMDVIDIPEDYYEEFINDINEI